MLGFHVISDVFVMKAMMGPLQQIQLKVLEKITLERCLSNRRSTPCMHVVSNLVFK